jgi:hypothetical protein
MRYTLSIIGLAVIVGVGYFAVAQYVSVAHGQSSLLVANQSTEGMNADGAQVIALLARLKAIKLNGQIFSDSHFTALQDWSVTIAPQPVGRANPFLPAYGAASVVSSSSTKVALPKSTR